MPTSLAAKHMGLFQGTGSVAATAAEAVAASSFVLTATAATCLVALTGRQPLGASCRNEHPLVTELQQFCRTMYKMVSDCLHRTQP